MHTSQRLIYLPTPSSTATLTPPSVGLVRKLVSVLETEEKLPVFSHDSPGQVLNLQVHYPWQHCQA